MVSPSRNDWSLHRKGPADQARHNQKIREAIKENLSEIIAEESIITSDGTKIIKVPIRSLEEYKFRFDPYRQNRVGQGTGDSKVGDVIGRLPSSEGPGQGRKAGDQPGVDYYEAELTIDELGELIFEDLGLPNLRPKACQEIPSDTVRFTEVRKKGLMGNLDKRRTIMENIRRNALYGDPSFHDLTNDDLRFKTWVKDTRRENNAVVLAMRDASGSMGEFKKYITRSLFFWMVRFLRTKYANVEIVFMVHHTEAREVEEEAFFHLGESGGTKVSSAYQLCWDLINQRYNPSRWNIYPFHFSDGESCTTFCMNLMRCRCGGLSRLRTASQKTLQRKSACARVRVTAARRSVRSPALPGGRLKKLWTSRASSTNETTERKIKSVRSSAQ